MASTATGAMASTATGGGLVLLFFAFVAGVPLLALLLGEQLQNALPLRLVGDPLQELAVVTNVLASDEALHGSSPDEKSRPRIILNRSNKI
jgi:hypothetical protein